MDQNMSVHCSMLSHDKACWPFPACESSCSLWWPVFTLWEKLLIVMNLAEHSKHHQIRWKKKIICSQVLSLLHQGKNHCQIHSLQRFRSHQCCLLYILWCFRSNSVCFLKKVINNQHWMNQWSASQGFMVLLMLWTFYLHRSWISCHWELWTLREAEDWPLNMSHIHQLIFPQ